MPEKDVDIRVRLTSQEKEEWNKFIEKTKDFENLSQLIRYCVRGYILGDLIEKKSSSQNGEKKESEIDSMIDLLKEMKELKKTQETQSQQLYIVSSYITNGQKTFPSEPIETMKKNNIETEIINLLEIRPLTSEELAKAFKMEEHRILRFLNPMVKTHTLGFNNKMEYVIVEHENQLKELKFDEVE